MKVPTYHKFGLTKSQVNRSELRDKKISDVLTHYLTIGIGLSLGLVVYIIYYNEVRPSTFIQIVMQVFLFGSMGVLCVGIPAVLFKLAEMFYFKQFKEKTEEHKTITKFQEERDEFDFWKLRKDYSFWKILDGLSFEKEVMNIYMQMGYEDEVELCSEDYPDDRILSKDEELLYFYFHTKAMEISENALIDELLLRMKKSGCSKMFIFAQSGYNKKTAEYAKVHSINLLDINGIIKVVRTIKEKEPVSK
jgi:Restriction endonuclease